MRRAPRYVIVGSGVVAAAVLGYWYGSNHVPSPPAASVPAQATANVTTIALRKGSLSAPLELLGVTVPRPSNLHSYSVPYESQIVAVKVSQGQRVSAGDPLVVLEDSPASALDLRDARSAVSVSESQVAIAEDRLKAGLGTDDAVLRAKANLANAKAKLSSLLGGGSRSGQRPVTALLDGVVSDVLVRAGDTVGAGAPIVRVVDRNSIQVQLSAEAEDVHLLRAGMPVEVAAVGSSPDKASVGQITLVADEVDPATRLVRVLVDVPAAAGLLLNEFVRGTVRVSTADGFLVPRAAVVAGDAGYLLYTVDNGVARAHHVTMSVDNDGQSLVVGDGLTEGVPVVVTGAYQVEDGMAVTTAAGGSPSSAPAATPPAGGAPQ